MEEHDTDRALAELHADTDLEMPIEVYSGAGRRGGERVCFIAAAALDEGSIGLQRILGPGQWRLVARRPDGTLRSASVNFAGRPRAFAFSSPHYIGPDAADLVGTPWGPAEAPPPPPASSSGSSIDQIVALAGAMRAMAPPPPDLTPILAALAGRQQAAPDLTPVLVAMLQNQPKGPSALELLELMKASRPEPQEPFWGRALEVALPVAGPILGQYLEMKAGAAGAESLAATLATAGAKLLEQFTGNGGDDDEADDEEEEAPPAPPTTPPTA